MLRQKKVKELSLAERPREKLVAAGSSRLSERELLVVLLGSSPQESEVMATAQRILGKFKNLRKGACVARKNKKRILADLFLFDLCARCFDKTPACYPYIHNSKRVLVVNFCLMIF